MKERKSICKKRVLVCILAAVMVISVTACGSSGKGEPAIKETISNFETACKNLDGDAILDCLDPEIADPIRTGGNLLNFVGIDTDELVAAAATSIFGENYADSEFLQTLSIKVSEVEAADSGTSATASGTISYEWDGETRSEDVDIEMIHSGDDEETGWYIEDIIFK